jgi:hypothetical protein
MAPPETYNMREIGGGGHGAHGPAPGEVFDYNSIGVAGAGGAAGAAGIGVARARSTRDGGSYGQALQEGGSPYPAFVAPSSSGSPPPQQPHPYGREYPTARGHELEVLENAGMGVHAAGAGAGLYNNNVNGQQGTYDQYAQGGRQQTQPSYDQPQGLVRNKSLVSHEAEIVYPTAYSTPPPPPPGYSSGYSSPQQHHQQYTVQEEDEDDAYGGYVVTDDNTATAASAYNQPRPQQGQMPVPQTGSGNSSGNSFPNPFEGQQGQGQGVDRRMSDSSVSEYEDEEPKRVLKVRC